MNRVLTFHHHGTTGNETRMLPTYYIEADYTPVAVRIHAEDAPTSDAEVDIFDDGVSIFNSRASNLINPSSGVRTIVQNTTAVVLPAGSKSEENAEDFSNTLIEEGSWVHCSLVNAGGGFDFSVHLEISSSDEPLTEEE